jgi:ribosome-binding factor A
MERVNEQLKRELSEIVRTDLRDPRVTGVTVTAVEASRDLTFARVFVHLTGTDPERAEAIAGLEAAAVYVRRRLADMLPLRHTPTLRFVEDRAMAHGSRIEILLAEIEIPPEGEDPDEQDEPGPEDDELTMGEEPSAEPPVDA